MERYAAEKAKTVAGGTSEVAPDKASSMA